MTAPTPEPIARPVTDPGNPFALGDHDTDVVMGYTNDGKMIITFHQGGITFTVKMDPDKAVALGRAITGAASAIPTSSGLLLPPGAGARLVRPHGPKSQNGATS